MAKSNEELDSVEKQWDEWNKNNDTSLLEVLNDKQLREFVVQDLEIVSKMSVEEYTLYQKWQEIHWKYPIINTLFGVDLRGDDEQEIKGTKSNIWMPQKPDDYLNLKPVLIYTNNNPKLNERWNTIRTFTSTMKNANNIGRNLTYIVQDDVTGKYLGVICISSDFLDLTPRDKFIGWDRSKKTDGRMINHTAIGSTIVPLQPLGFGYTGGKLLALLCLSDEVQNRWKSVYGDVLVGVTTTSLYGKSKVGGLSQYDRLTHWKKMGYTEGSVSFEPSRDTRNKMIDWLKKNEPRKYFEWYVAKNLGGQPYKRDHKNRSYNFIYSKLNIPKELIRTDHCRGIYFSPLYTNTNDFLCGRIRENQLVKSFDTSYDALVNNWKEKYASKRIRSIIERGTELPETLFYDDIAFMTWEETKFKYLSQVGR